MAIQGPEIPVIVMLLVVPITVIGVPIARAIARRIDRPAARPAVSPDVMARFERLEQSVDAIAVEVERIAEGQRFVTRLLSERRADALPSATGKPS
jgi:hypothetical protein